VVHATGQEVAMQQDKRWDHATGQKVDHATGQEVDDGTEHQVDHAIAQARIMQDVNKIMLHKFLQELIFLVELEILYES
jgi:hypothetical protein